MDAINSIGDLFNIFEELYSYLKITSNIRLMQIFAPLQHSLSRAHEKL